MTGETAGPETGYAPVNGLQMYYEVHATAEPRCCSCTAGFLTSSSSSVR